MVGRPVKKDGIGRHKNAWKPLYGVQMLAAMLIPPPPILTCPLDARQSFFARRLHTCSSLPQ